MRRLRQKSAHAFRRRARAWAHVREKGAGERGLLKREQRQLQRRIRMLKGFSLSTRAAKNSVALLGAWTLCMASWHKLCKRAGSALLELLRLGVCLCPSLAQGLHVLACIGGKTGD